MNRRAFCGTVAGGLLALPIAAGAQPADRPYHIGVVLAGGPYLAALDGLRAGLKEQGLEEARHYVLHVHDVQGDPNAVGPAARALEKEKVDLIYSVTTSITLATRQATARVPIVFYAGSDPVVAGLVQSFRKPGGRLTGVYSRTVDLTPKRFELLKTMLPRLRRVVTSTAATTPSRCGPCRRCVRWPASSRSSCWSGRSARPTSSARASSRSSRARPTPISRPATRRS